MKKDKRNRKRIRRYIFGTLIGVGVGFAVNQATGNMSSQCMLLCDPRVAMAYFGLVGLVLSLK